ncbi:MAG: Gfo/Idh/MocA family oxidoreductase [Defluviitaleaceae bacterium]|nr:Gfo/Idh/MocA family oxidoreductase [Defluviitaleaceae bacterium]
MGFKICLVGCGAIALHQHGPAIKRYAEFNLDTVFAACCDTDKERAIAFKEAFGLPKYYTNINEMLNNERPQAVSLTVPTGVTASLSCKILSMGYPLILEKPPGLNSAETLRMAESAKDVPNFVAFNRRYMPIVQKAASLINKWGGADIITDINYRMIRVGRADSDFSTTAIHGIDLVKYIAQSDYKNVAFKYKEMPQYGKTVANFHMFCEMENGVVTCLDFLPMSGLNTERIEINTHNGLLVLCLPIWAGCFDGHGKLSHYVKNEEVLCIKGDEFGSTDEFVIGGFYHENEAFFDGLKRGELFNDGIKSGLQSVDIVDCIRNRRAHYA